MLPQTLTFDYLSRLQAAGQTPGAATSSSGVIRAVVQADGVTGLWKGALPGLVSVCVYVCMCVCVCVCVYVEVGNSRPGECMSGSQNYHYVFTLHCMFHNFTLQCMLSHFTGSQKCHYVFSLPCTFVGLARTVYTHRI